MDNEWHLDYLCGLYLIAKLSSRACDPTNVLSSQRIDATGIIYSLMAMIHDKCLCLFGLTVVVPALVGQDERRSTLC
jgi:hypothetical protein